MRKSLVWVASLFLLPAVCFAFPEVGDSAQYSITIGTSGQSSSDVQTVALGSFNSSSSQYQMEVTTTSSGSSTTKTSSLDASALYSSATISKIISQCAQLGGVLGSTTVAAGTFQTCAVSKTPGSTIWYGQVPFGIVRMSVTNSSQQFVQVLDSYQVGSKKGS